MHKFRGLFRGLGPPLTAAAVITGVTFESYEQASARMKREFFVSSNHALKGAAGAAAGFVQSFIACPVERLKCLIIVLTIV